MKTGDSVVFIYAAVLEEDYNKVVIPPGSFAKAIKVGNIEDLLDQEACKGWGAMAGIALCRLANHVCPELGKILKAVPSEQSI